MLQHINVNGMDFIDAGAAGGKYDPVATSGAAVPAQSNVKFALSNIGSFAMFQALGNTLTLTFVDQNGNNVYCANINGNRRNVVDPPPPTLSPTKAPSLVPSASFKPTAPTLSPSTKPTTLSIVPSMAPTMPTMSPSKVPSMSPTGASLMPFSPGTMCVLVHGDWGVGNAEQQLVANQVCRLSRPCSLESMYA